MDKAALLERLVRLGATDVPGTPRLLMKHRSPAELGQLQQSVEGAFKKVQDPLKAHAGKLLSKMPGGKVLQQGANLLIDNPETLPMQAVPIPGLTPGYLLAKKGLERTIDRMAPVKLAFKGKGVFRLPVAHEPAVTVPKGGSCCANCRYVSQDLKNCGNPNYATYYKTTELPAPADELCSDWWEPREAAGLKKVAFTTSQYSTPLNPEIRSGASVLPPFKAPSLRAAIQKNSGAVTPASGPEYGDLTKAGSVDEFLAKLAALGVGQWWEQVGGPHLAKGGSHIEFQKMMDAEGLPKNIQEKFMRVAKEKYPPGYSGRSAPSGGGSTGRAPPSFHVPANAANVLGGTLAAALGGRLIASKADDDPEAAPQRWKGRLGAYMQNAPLPYAGYMVGRLFGGPRGAAIGGLGGAGLGALVGEGMLHEADKRERVSGRRAAKTEAGQHRVLEAAGASSAGLGRAALVPRIPMYALGAYLTHGNDLGVDAATLATQATGMGLYQRYSNLLARQAMEEAQKEGVKPEPKKKAAASDPTRGGFLLASDLPPFRAPRLDRAIQKNGGNAPIPASGSVKDNPYLENSGKYAGPPPKKEKDSDGLGIYAPYSPSDFKRSKYAGIDAGAVVEALNKQAAGLTPAGQLAKTQSIGAPKATAPPGPSIAQIAKPRGARFGVGIPGAFKSRIGGDSGVSLS